MTIPEQIEQLKAEIKKLEKEWEDFHKSNHITSYSYPVWQVTPLKKKIKDLEKQQARNEIFDGSLENLRSL